MYKIAFILFNLLVTSSITNGAVIKNEPIEICDYLINHTGDTYIYQATFSNKTTTDTTITKKGRISNDLAYYSWENSPPYYFLFSNSFIGGAVIVRNDSIFFENVKSESNLINLKAEDFKLLFPKTIEIGATYKSIDLYKNQVEYEILGMEEIMILGKNYADCIRIKKTVFFKNTQEVHHIWLAKNIGVVKWIRPTGRIELLQDFIKAENPVTEIQKLGARYINSNGIALFESELSNAHKFNSDFSTPVYDNQGRLIREDFYGCTGEMGIKFITYKYNENNFLIEECYHYTESLDPAAEIKKIWVNEYVYDKKGKLIETKHKFDQNDKDYYKTRKFDHLDKTEAEKIRFSSRHPLFKIQ